MVLVNGFFFINSMTMLLFRAASKFSMNYATTVNIMSSAIPAEQRERAMLRNIVHTNMQIFNGREVHITLDVFFISHASPFSTMLKRTYIINMEIQGKLIVHDS